MIRLLTLLPLAALAAACAPAAPPAQAPSPALPLAALEAELREVIRSYAGDTAEVGVAFKDMGSGDSLLINARTVMHAASTMKVPVMLELFRRADAGELDLDAPVVVRNEFGSIADGSTYSLSTGDDSDAELYRRIGESVPMRRMIELMITRSSNLATNILIEIAEPARIARTLEELGASEMRALRGVEDNAAFQRGMNNSTTAYGFMKVLEAIASGRAASPRATQQMLEILQRQEFRENIPAGLPAGVRVGNKTGWITGINHDGAVIFPEGRPPYVLVVLTRGFKDRKAAVDMTKEISARVYRAVVGG